MRPESLREVVSRQLGRPVRGVAGAAAWCPFSLPAVVETVPYLEGGTPFPTLYYLTCPTSVEAAATMEARGAVSHIRVRLASDRECAGFLATLEGAYGSRRKSLAAPDVHGAVDGGASLATGIGGVREPGAAKCVHALLAAVYAAMDGSLGPEAEGVARRLQSCLGLPEGTWCDDRRCGRYVPGSRRRAAVDVGTNSVRLLVADLADDAAGSVVRRSVITRLGEDLRTGGGLSKAAQTRSRSAIDDFVGEARSLGAEDIVVAGTSAVREAEDGPEFLTGIGRELGVEVCVLDEKEEALLSFRGATQDISGDVVLLDVGGGSTELARSSPEGDVASVSLRLGSVRQTQRWFTEDPPPSDERRRLAEEARKMLAPCRAGFGRADEPEDGGRGGGSQLVGVAGTVTTLACIALDLPGYDPEAIHLSRIHRRDLTGAVERLASLTAEERLRLPCMQEGREKVIVAGGEILLAALDCLGFDDVVVSERDILDGLVGA